MSAPVLEITGLRVATSHAEVLHGIDLSVTAGQLSALVGESGSGKTMAARAVMRLLPGGLRITGGSIRLDGEDITSASERRMRTLRGPGAGMVFQEPMVSLNPAITIGSQMAEGLAQHRRLSRAEIRALSLAMLDRVHIADPVACLRAFPHQFSGGMRQRILLASVMLLKPRLLVADEPTTALDTLAQREVLDLMVELARENGTAVLLITHNLGLVSRYTQEMTVLKAGDVVERGSTARIIEKAEHPYTQELVAAARRSDDAPSAPAGKSPRELVRAEAVAVTFPGRSTHAVNGVDLSIGEGETVALVGGSGSGKTTMGRAILGLLPLASGTVSFRGRPITLGGAADRDARLACQMVFQDPYSSLDPRQRIGAIVREPLRHIGDMTSAEKEARVAETMADVGLSGMERRFPHELSGGQRQRIAIARAIVRRPAFVVADEPVSALDMTIQAQVLALLLSLQARYGFACLFISHDLSAVRRIAQRIVVMENGRVVEEGPTAAVLDRPSHPYTRRLVEAAPVINPASVSIKALEVDGQLA
ncbi:ABC transporter ATP-binding protein [Mesorhizobium sp. DCY119]|uniref:dipeptide ABC transporter ATP-binding protein n=1 Tax=Mesorhizobium sp. DCY119 TaxID=2108445 RepID=UPI000E737702|nr:ABC transporter ATP-binding protein [Mesorhizobium sp. DCY119]RJG40676.1 ABC transporter ATP-binding protein [Mesorhizobium sp. DCY119]